MTWRPKDWKNPYSHRSVDYNIYEEGADALLKSLVSFFKGAWTESDILHFINQLLEME